MLYDIGFLIFSIFYLPTLLFRGRLHRDFLERFGIYSKTKFETLTSKRKKIWIHAVSVGEVSLCKRLITSLREKFPDEEVIVSTITKTGNDLAKKIYSKDATVIYFPLDLSFVVKRVATLIRPDCYIMVETELWPNLLREISAAHVPSILINGRISDRSFVKYRLARSLLRDVLRVVGLFCMQSELDAERIIYLGAPRENVRVTGNMKFDIELDLNLENAKKIRDILGLKEDDEIYVAGSTHKGEERMVLEVYKKLIKEFPRLRLLIAPRHIERAHEIEALVNRFGFTAVRISQASFDPRLPSTSLGTGCTLYPVFILDTIGELRSIYSIATLIFVGGSLIRHGGQNPIEPAIFEKPILFGPYMFNFRDIARIFLESGAAIQVMDKKDLFENSALLLKDEARRTALGKNARKALLKNCGATERNLKAIYEKFYICVNDR